ncbi:uncharacterized protein LOC116303257 [Actinia tenebrosa]|uniref:Uncharacterized protein LOC116303257 n=1 Tax=Actinia tenebrosa TaxID=6105 RepID=A0A6P8IQT1_ACTTE|nr:uncharacterized protein LOC116303257 [Actinia tenebrosa]
MLKWKLSRSFCRAIMSKLLIEGEGLTATVTLNDGHKMPLFGLGVYQAKPEETSNATTTAIQHGYRMIDTAALYGNEKEVGEGIKKSGVNREDIFVTSKVYPNKENHGYNESIRAVKESLAKLDTGYIDLYLIHSPSPGKNIETYDGLLKMKEEGLIRSVGVSNFGIHHLEALKKSGRPTPAVNQIELNCFCRREDTVKYCRDHGIVLEGFCPIFRGRKNNDPCLVEIAKRYNKTVPQLLNRWSVQKQFVTIPKSVKPDRIMENAQIFDFVISDKDMQVLDNLPTERCSFLNMKEPAEAPWVS